MRRLEGKVAIVAGGGGIGGATALRLAEEGAAVMIGDINADSARATADAIVAAGGKAQAMAYDAADDASIGALVAATVDAFGRLDFMHANAADMQALMSDTNALDVPLDIFDRTIAVNLRGALLCARHALPHLIANKGVYVVTSSSAAHMGEPQRVAYAMTKSGVNALVRHIASRWGKDGVRANAICPGMVMTDFHLTHMPAERVDEMLQVHRSPRLGRVEDIAAMVAMLFSKDGEWINGQVLAVDGGASIRP